MTATGLDSWGIGRGDSSQILNDLFGVFRLASTRFTGDKNALILAFVDQVAERFIGHGENMRLGILPSPSPIHVDIFPGVYRKGAVRVDGDQEQPRVRLLLVKDA